MSTGQNCQYIEGKLGSFYIILEHSNAPKNAWNWRENADCYGSFCSFKACGEYMRRFFANPGGHSEVPYYSKLDSDLVLQDLMAKATKPHLTERWH